MKIVIVGAGKIGYSLAEELANENHDITVVDIDKEKVKLLSDTLDVMTLCGNGASSARQTLTRATCSSPSRRRTS